MRGGLTLHRRIQCEYQFLVRPEPGKESLDIEIVRADAIERRQGSTQHVIASPESSGSLERPEVGKVFDDTNRHRVPLRVLADRARFDRVEIAADPARADRVRRLRQRRRQWFEEAFAPLNKMQRGTPGRAG